LDCGSLLPLFTSHSLLWDLTHSPNHLTQIFSSALLKPIWTAAACSRFPSHSLLWDLTHSPFISHKSPAAGCWSQFGLRQPAAAFTSHSLLWDLTHSPNHLAQTFSSRLLKPKRQQAAAVQGFSHLQTTAGHPCTTSSRLVILTIARSIAATSTNSTAASAPFSLPPPYGENYNEFTI
jgi:hypothetical protein